uniref:Uncharacterized protein n=1 Tax=Mustela putorius furo TaxID=9669 RepID=M3Y9G2_MUSPF
QRTPAASLHRWGQRPLGSGAGSQCVWPAGCWVSFSTRASSAPRPRHPCPGPFYASAPGPDSERAGEERQAVSQPWATHRGRGAPVALLQKLLQRDHLTARRGRAGPSPRVGLCSASLLDAVLGERPVPGQGVLMAAGGGGAWLSPAPASCWAVGTRHLRVCRVPLSSTPSPAARAGPEPVPHPGSHPPLPAGAAEAPTLPGYKSEQEGHRVPGSLRLHVAACWDL